MLHLEYKLSNFTVRVSALFTKKNVSLFELIFLIISVAKMKYISIVAAAWRILRMIAVVNVI